jgi:phytoene/squalene synthetase
MEMDLSETSYNSDRYKEYIYGSAEVVGLMCLKVFCEGKEAPYQELKKSARALGAAFQKVNFLRDIGDDFQTRGRSYFPELNLGIKFDSSSKKLIEKDIETDFQEAYQGILQLPNSSKFGVLTAYWFYKNLFNKIRKTQAEEILQKRIRINNWEKAAVFAGVMVRYRLNFI